ncbi:MAG TPA: iron transporter [Alphaproteobacteria bacterium]|nr:iron transporter [Alphaproteobacteria bacterium]
MRNIQTAAALALAAALLPLPLMAEEFNIGKPVVKEAMQIVPNYLVGIQMDPMPRGMSMTPDAIHLEADVHATKDNKHGYKEDDWIPYLTITYTLEATAKGVKYKKTGELAPMIAADGVHYANNVAAPPAGAYRLTYHIDPPSKKGFARHTDKATGVPEWWKPFDVSWDFDYPVKK